MAQLDLLQPLVCNALEAVEMKLIRHQNDVDDETVIFHPEYAHQIFGENEMIFGYKDLKIRLYYTAASLQIYLGIKYSYRVDDMINDSLKADDVTSKIASLITSGIYYTNVDEFLLKLKKDESFQPLGDKIDTFACEDSITGETRTFEYYKCDATTPNFVQFHTRLQTLILWFVDAANYIDIDDPQWLFFVCYEKYKNSEGKTMYATVGYSTIYLYYAYPAHIRPRISQVLVLPPFQQLGLGTKTVQVIYKYFGSDPNVRDITVEDPSDDFRRIRNYVDIVLCKDLPAFSPDNLRKGFSQSMIEEANESFKINSRQCRIIYEILRLHHTNIHNERDYRNYRLDVKKRLNLTYHKQKEDIKKLEKAGMDSQWMLAGLASTSERIEQLKEEYQDIEKEYQRILKRLKN